MSKNKFVVLLDAGHGGMINGKYVTPGKRSPIWKDKTQYFEGVGNRLIREEIMIRLDAECINYRVVNSGEADMDLYERVDIVNGYVKKFGSKNCLLISIHSDGFTEEQAHGWSTYTTKGQTNSDKFATILYEEAAQMWSLERFREDNRDGDPDKEANYLIIRKSNCPAVLTENFFHSNEKDCKTHLMNKHGRIKIAQVHVNAIKRWIDELYK